MKYPLLFLLLLLSARLSAQSLEAEELFRTAKSEFNKKFAEQDYTHAASLLEKAVELETGNAEFHYFLGYAYDRMNAKDARDITQLSAELTHKVSRQFETVNKLTPHYKGELVLLDPYSKITSIWGSLAMKYEYCHQPDSAVWALKEGRKRGGYKDFFLATLRSAVDLCAPGSLLFISGDNFIYPLLYLQKIAKYRTDVTPVVMSLLESKWYPRFLQDQYGLAFGRGKAELDSLTYCYCTDSVFHIKVDKGISYSWKIASREDSYLYRSDLLFLDLLKENQFKREVYFTSGMPLSDLLGLRKDLNSLIIVKYLNYDNRPMPKQKDLETQVESQLECMKYVNKNRKDELYTVGLIRIQILDKISDEIKHGNFQSANRLMQLLKKRIPAVLYPMDDYILKYYEHIKLILDEEIPPTEQQ